MRAAGASVADVADKATAATKEGEKFRRGLDTLGGAAGKVGLVAAAGLGAAIVKAANFDQAMSNVQAATMESAANMELFRKAALDAGAETVFSATESAAAIEELSKAGVSTADILSGGLQGALDLAAAGQLEVAEAAEYTATALNQFQLAGDQATHVADLLAAGAGKAQGEVSDMANALNYAGVPASNLGVTIEETAGAVALLASNGIIGEQAGTSLRGMLASLTSPSKVAAKEMERLGISVFDTQGKFVGFDGIAGQLQARMSGLTDAERANALGKIFGNEQLQAANVLYREGEEGVKAMTSAVDDNGYAAEAASTRLDNLKGDLEQLGGALETALIGTGDGSQGALRSLTQGLTRVVDVYNDLPSAAKTAAGGIVAAGAVVGGSIWVGSKVVRGISDTREALDNLGISGGKASGAIEGLARAGVVATGIYALAGAAVELSNRLDEALPGLDTLEGRLINIANTPEGFSLSIGAEFDSLAGSLDRIGDPSRWQRINDAAGAFNDLVLPGDARDRGLREAEAEVQALDEALSSLVSSGNSEVAAAALERLTSAYGLSESQVETLKDELPLYGEALAAVSNDAKLAADGSDEASAAAEGLGAQAKYTADELKVMQEALQDARDAARQVAEQYFSVSSAVDDADGSLDKFLNSLEQQANALVKVRENAKLAGENGVRKGLIRELEEAGPAGAVILEKLAKSTETQIGRANAAYSKGKKGIDDYVSATVKVPKALKTDLTLTGVPEALKGISQVRAQLNNVDRDRVIKITTVYDVVNSASDALPPRRKADGGFIAGPGTATSDSIPAYLSNGEYVIRAAAVQKYGMHMFDSLNAMHFADGGSTSKGKKPKPAGGLYVFDNTDRLQEVIANLTEVASRQTDALQAATAKQDYWAGKMSDLAQATVSGFNTGLFDKSSDPWAAGAGGGPIANLLSDIAGLNQRQGLQSQLAGMGLSGETLAALLSQGSNSDISALIASGQVGQYASLYAQRSALQGSVGGFAGQAAYGSEYKAAREDYRAQTAVLQATQLEIIKFNTKLERVESLLAKAPDSTGAAVGREINSAAAQGQRQRERQGGGRV